jgi:transcription-repair coupling factor (superfamily II helicase)
MLFPSVTENLSRLVRHRAMDDALAALRRGAPRELLAGMTDPVKALVAALVAAELRRPVLLLVESDRRAEELLELLRFFARAVSGPAAQAVVLPALDQLPGRGAGPHAEILETRAASLWRFTSGQVSLLIATAAASVLPFGDSGGYANLALSLEIDQELSLDDALRYLRRAGYARTDLVEMPGQYALRGGILDVYPPESPRPVRVELLGDTVESLREFDPESQRSTGPLGRVALSSLTEFAAEEAGANSETSVSGAARSGMATLFDLRDELLVMVDEPERVQAAAAEARERFSLSDSDGEAPTGLAVLGEQAWKDALGRRQQLALEQLPLRRDGADPAVIA